VVQHLRHLIVGLVAHRGEQRWVHGIGLGVERIEDAAHDRIIQGRTHFYYDTLLASSWSLLNISSVISTPAINPIAKIIASCR
jgi:hypothetical protein